jgi:hypothetical protein
MEFGANRKYQWVSPTGLSGAPLSLRPLRGCCAPLLSLARRLRCAPAPRRGLLPPLGRLRHLRFLRPVTPGAVIRRCAAQMRGSAFPSNSPWALLRIAVACGQGARHILPHHGVSLHHISSKTNEIKSDESILIMPSPARRAPAPPITAPHDICFIHSIILFGFSGYHHMKYK